MGQEDINKDLGSYLHERKTRPFWNKILNSNPRPKREVQEELKQELEEKAAHEDISPEEKKELEHMEEKIEEVNKVEGDIEEEHESLMRKFFKKLNFSKKIDADDEAVIVHDEDANGIIEHPGQEEIHAEALFANDDEELREMLKRMHEWVVQLPPEKLSEFRNSEDFKLYTKVLKKHGLIR
jgi:flagellar biosynthesis GTPase FlhF